MDEQSDPEDREPSQGINVATGEQQNDDNNEIGGNMFETQLSDEILDRKFEKRSNRNSVEKGLDEETAAMKSVIHEDDNKSQDSLAEYEKIISEKLELK